MNKLGELIKQSVSSFLILSLFFVLPLIVLGYLISGRGSIAMFLFITFGWLCILIIYWVLLVAVMEKFIPSYKSHKLFAPSYKSVSGLCTSKKHGFSIKLPGSWSLDNAVYIDDEQFIDDQHIKDRLYFCRFRKFRMYKDGRKSGPNISIKLDIRKSKDKNLEEAYNKGDFKNLLSEELDTYRLGDFTYETVYKKAVELGQTKAYLIKSKHVCKGQSFYALTLLVLGKDVVYTLEVLNDGNLYDRHEDLLKKTLLTFRVI